jgi:hypothetical protein
MTRHCRARPSSDACNAHPKHLSPAMGVTCGRREREARCREAKRSNPFTHPGRQRWKAPRFTGCRQPSRGAGAAWVLTGPSRRHGARSHAGGRTGDNRCPLDAEEGNVVSVRQAHALNAEAPKKRPPRSRTRPSLGPETRARHRHQTRLVIERWSSKDENGKSVARSLRYRGRANLRKQEEPAPGPKRTNRRTRGSPRVTASPVKRRRSCVMRQKRKEVMAFVPARKRELRFRVRTSCSVAEVGRQSPGLE